MENRIYHIHALTALHVGTGQGIDIIDLPIARDRSTGLPLVPGSGLKGVLREELRPDDQDDPLWNALFGPTSRKAEQDHPHAGALSLGDAQLLALPVRSAWGTFAWITSPLVLRRYRRDLAANGAEQLPDIPEPNEDQALHAPNGVVAQNDQVVLEAFDLQAQSNDTVQAWAKRIATTCFDDDWADLFQTRFLVIHDTLFDHLAQTATEVRPRVRIDPDTRTVAKGALWYEENLPPETLLWGWLACSRSRRKNDTKSAAELLEAFGDQLLHQGQCRLQLGGKATIGRGQVRWLLEV